jgi:hypothetical protein
VSERPLAGDVALRSDRFAANPLATGRQSCLPGHWPRHGRRSATAGRAGAAGGTAPPCASRKCRSRRVGRPGTGRTRRMSPSSAPRCRRCPGGGRWWSGAPNASRLPCSSGPPKCAPPCESGSWSPGCRWPDPRPCKPALAPAPAGRRIDTESWLVPETPGDGFNASPVFQGRCGRARRGAWGRLPHGRGRAASGGTPGSAGTADSASAASGLPAPPAHRGALRAPGRARGRRPIPRCTRRQPGADVYP